MKKSSYDRTLIAINDVSCSGELNGMVTAIRSVNNFHTRISATSLGNWSNGYCFKRRRLQEQITDPNALK